MVKSLVNRPGAPAVSGLLLLFCAVCSPAADTRVLPGHVPAAVSNFVAIGRLPGSQRLNLALGLPLRNRQELTHLLRELYNPASSQYHQYLTPEQFTELFGPSTADYSAAKVFAQANNFAVTRTYPNRVVLDVGATVADIEKAFHITLRLYQHPAEARTFYAPDSEPSVDGNVPILDISGLDNFVLPRPLLRRSRPVSPVQPAYGSGPGGSYIGKDFRAAYAPNVSANGLGQTVGLLEFDGYYPGDITSYETQAGLPNVPLKNVLLDNFNGSPGSGNIEVALDIEMAIAMAPGLNQVIVYEAGPRGNPNDILSQMVNENTAKALSSSWTWSGAPSGTTDALFQQMAAQGQSFFQAAGDSGAYTSSIPQPADNPYVTIVGGTTLTTSGPGGPWVSETTWNWYNTGIGTNGTGGGISTSYTIPSWQQGISMSANQGSTIMRNIPDVALAADNIWVTYDNGSSGYVGGTSCAAPLWAAFTALINQQAAGNGKPSVGFLNPVIYSLGKGNSYGSCFHDISTGNNTNNTSPAKFSAVTGLDLCTGWGTPTGSGLINALAGSAAPQIVSNGLTLTVETCVNNAVDPGETVTLLFGLINTGSGNTTNLVATLQPGGGVTSPSAAQTYGMLTPGGSAVTRPFTFTAAGTCGSTVTATLQLQDGASNLGAVSFVMRLGKAATGTTFSENFDGLSPPALPSSWTATVLSGFEANWSTTNGFFDTAPNSAYVPDAMTAGETALVSPIMRIASSSAQLTFNHNYDLAWHTTLHPRSTTYYNGGVLEISIGGGPFTDIVAAGGIFLAGGYNCTLAGGTGNPLSGSQAWGGNSGGWLSTTLMLPPAALGQNIQLRWSCGSGINTSPATGWFVDSISIRDTSFQCCVPSADLTVTQTAAPAPAAVNQNLTYTLTISNPGPVGASNIAVTDSLPSSVTFVSASPGCINLGSAITCSIDSLAAGSTSNILLTVKPNLEGVLTNSVTVSSSTSDPNTNNNAAVITTPVYVAPSITAQPTNQVADVGGNASFSVTVSGSTPLSYQWTFSGNMLPGATTETLSLANIQPSQAGSYAVIVSNSAGSVTSSVATLTVVVPPSIVAQPTNQTIALGASATFQVGATGTAPLSYQWLFNGVNMAGSTSDVLGLANVETNQVGAYNVIVTNAAGSVTSAVANLTVVVPPSITLQPSNQVVVAGSNALFQAGADGSTQLNYQWFLGGTAVPGATSPVFDLTNVQPNQAGAYFLVAANSAGSATSVVAQLTVLVPPSITSQPTNQTAAVGDSINFRVSALGTPPLTYQWWFNYTNAVGTDTNTLTVTNVQPSQGGGYSVIVTNAAGCITSAVANLTIGTPPVITQQPLSIEVVQGQAASFNAAATGDMPLRFLWRFNGTSIFSATNSNFTLDAAGGTNSGSYDVVVSNIYGDATSAPAKLRVLVPPSIINISANGTSVSVSLGTLTSLNYQLQYKDNLGDPVWTPISSSVPGTGAILVLQDTNATSASRFYRIDCQ